ncbi:MAG: hypothetical protein ACO1N3_00980 [Gammaproteobacteria bacterium]
MQQSIEMSIHDKSRENEKKAIMALSSLIDDQVEHERKKRKLEDSFPEKADNSSIGDRGLRQLLQIVGINDECGCNTPHGNQSIIINPKLLVLYYALKNYVKNYNIDAEEKIDLYSPIKNPTKDLLKAVEKSGDITFNSRFGVFAVKPGHTIPMYIDNPVYSGPKNS